MPRSQRDRRRESSREGSPQVRGAVERLASYAPWSGAIPTSMGSSHRMLREGLLYRWPCVLQHDRELRTDHQISLNGHRLLSAHRIKGMHATPDTALAKAVATLQRTASSSGPQRGSRRPSPRPNQKMTTTVPVTRAQRIQRSMSLLPLVCCIMDGGTIEELPHRTNSRRSWATHPCLNGDELQPDPRN